MKTKKMELSELFNGKLTLESYHCFNPKLEVLYYDYLNNKGIELQYNKKNLKKYIDEQKESLLEDKQEKSYKNFEKKLKINFLKKCLFRILIKSGYFSIYVTGKNATIHEQCNVVNSYLMLNNLSDDSNLDGIPEIDTNVLKYVDEYSKPTDNKFYADTSLYYILSKNLRISDNISFMIAMDRLNYDIVEIDGTLYSKTGKITQINYVENGENKINCTSKIFETNEELYEHLNAISDNLPYNREIKNVTTKLYDVKKLESIPTIKKNKKDGTITIEKSINKIQTNVAMKLLK